MHLDDIGYFIIITVVLGVVLLMPTFFEKFTK